MSCSKLNAYSQCCPFSQALIAALQLTHGWPCLQAPTAALKLTQFLAGADGCVADPVGLNPEVPLMTEPGEPLIIYERPAPVDSGAGAGSSASAAVPQQQCPSSMAEASAGGRRSSASSIGGAAGAASTTSAGTSQLYGV